MYSIIRNILFWFDAEKVHYFSMNMLSLGCRIALVRNCLKRKFIPEGPGYARTVFGINFTNPVGLAAGFDKNARYLSELATLGFGFVEIGTVTPLPQQGNPRPRLSRLPADKALINRMGFNNDGAKAVAERISRFRREGKNPLLVIGGNIGKNKATSNEDAWKDYETCFHQLHEVVDYFVVNVSSPNTPGLRELQQKDRLHRILTNLQDINKTKKIRKPLLLKISPDLNQQDLDEIIDLSLEIGMDGLVAANTTISRNHLASKAEKVDRCGAGGLSGRPLKEVSSRITAHIHQRTGGRIPVISSGGIFTARDVHDKFENGASLVQVWTGFIYEGPGIVKRILQPFKDLHPVRGASYFA